MQANLIKKCDGIPECDNKFLPVEVMATDMQRLDQWAERVVNYTSKYNTELSVSYSPENVVGKYEKYPSYGDFPETYFLVSTYLGKKSVRIIYFVVEDLWELVERK